MVDPINDPTPDPSGGNAPTPEPKPAGKPEITPEIQKIIDKAVTDRLAREQKAHEKEKAELAAKIKEFEDKDLGEFDKLKNKAEKLAKELTEKDSELTGTKLKLAKVEALLSAGATSEQIPKLLKRVSGTTEEEIAADVLELTTLGWIGQPAQPDPQKGAKGSGHKAPNDPPGIKTFTRSQIKAMSPEEYDKNRDDIMKSMESGKIVS